jgi:hypothetical protein
MNIDDIEVEVSGLSSMSFQTRFDGFGVPCDRCKKENAENRLSGDMPPGIPGTYCDDCHKIVCKEASDYYKAQFKEETKNLKITVLFRRQGKWSTDEINRLVASGIAEVWYDLKKTRYLVFRGHYTEKFIAKALLQVSSPYTVTRVVGTEDARLPFLPFD